MAVSILANDLGTDSLGRVSDKKGDLEILKVALEFVHQGVHFSSSQLSGCS
jgi:hypothetical protein